MAESPAKDTTTKKHRDFIAEPVGDKPVTKIPGIGKEIGGRMNAKGITDASELIGVFLTDKKDVVKLEDRVLAYGANKKQAKDCAEGVKAYVDEQM